MQSYSGGVSEKNTGNEHNRSPLKSIRVITEMSTIILLLSAVVKQVLKKVEIAWPCK